MPDDIRLKFSFKTSVKRKLMQRKLGAEGVLGLVDFWLTVGENHPRGILSTHTPEWIEMAADWSGEPGAFYAAMVELDLVVELEDGTWGVNDWPEHQEFLVGFEKRSKTAKAAAAIRWEKKEKSGGNAGRMRGADISETPDRTNRPTVPTKSTPQPPKGGPSFDDVWELVPNKQGKKAAEKSWKRLRKKHSAESLRTWVLAYACHVELAQEEYVLNGSTLLNNLEDWKGECPKCRGVCRPKGQARASPPAALCSTPDCPQPPNINGKCFTHYTSA